MTDERLTDEFAKRVMGWRVAPDRFLTFGKSWLPRRRFDPFQDLNHSFQVLEKSGSSFKVERAPGGKLIIEVHIAGSIGKACGGSPARAISLAIARALDLHVDQKELS